MTRRQAWTTVIAAISAVCALTGCSGSGKTTTPSPSSTQARIEAASTPANTQTSSQATTTPPARASTTADAATSDALLRQVVLVAADFPAGWSARAVSQSAANSSGQAALVACAGGRDTSGNKTATVNSASFTQSSSTVSSSVSRYKSQVDVSADTALLRSSTISACYQSLATKAVRTSLPAGATFVSADLKVLPTPAGAPKNVVALATGRIIVKVSGHTVTLYQTSAFITGRLIEAKVDLQGVDAPVAASTQERLIDLVAVRAAGV